MAFFPYGDGRTDIRAARPCYRDARMHLRKMIIGKRRSFTRKLQIEGNMAVEVEMITTRLYKLNTFGKLRKDIDPNAERKYWSGRTIRLIMISVLCPFNVFFKMAKCVFSRQIKKIFF